MLRAYCDGGKLHAGNTLRQLDLHARRRGAASLHHIAVVIGSDSSTCLHVAEAMLWNTMLEELPFSSAERAAMNAAELSQALPFPSIDRPRRLVGALGGWWDGAGAERRLRDQVGAAECRLCAIRDYYACQLHSRKPLIAWTRAAPRWPQTRGPTSTCHTRAPIHQRGGTTQAAARAVLWSSCGTWPRRSCRAESNVLEFDFRNALVRARYHISQIGGGERGRTAPASELCRLLGPATRHVLLEHVLLPHIDRLPLALCRWSRPAARTGVYGVLLGACRGAWSRVTIDRRWHLSPKSLRCVCPENCNFQKGMILNFM